ncbi:sigma factor-like helix-turn-helix DNA-binding protein, partial [Saccharothrix sp. NPDC042600]|uniref:RNA polymerase sigma factor n=1 Tax=Saccharothrix sp. NPDC042600 TaxID=3154492 RepID=UPI00340DF04E
SGLQALLGVRGGPETARLTRLLAGALAGLDPGDRDVLLLTSWAGLDSNEVAEALGIPVGTVRSRLHRVRRRLRAHAPETDRTRTGDE